MTIVEVDYCREGKHIYSAIYRICLSWGVCANGVRPYRGWGLEGHIPRSAQHFLKDPNSLEVFGVVGAKEAI